MTIVGTRPEIIRLSEIIRKSDLYFDQTLVHTGQNYDYELNRIFFEDLSLRDPDIYLGAAGEDLGDTIGAIIAKSYRLMAETKPEALLILGDTNSCLSALSAKRLHIPIFHLEAGNRCFDECLPEETNRRIVDTIADVNCCYSEHARRYLNAEGRPRERTYVIGSPMPEVLSANLQRIQESDILARLGLEKGKYLLLSAHREENIDDEGNFLCLMEAVNALAEKFALPVVYSTHPRSRKFIEQRTFRFHPGVRSLKPFAFSDYNHLQLHAFCVVSDSGTLPEESAFFAGQKTPFPAVCVRTSTERPEALEKGHFILAGITTQEVLRAVDIAVEARERGDMGAPVADYTDLNVSGKVIRLIQSYTGLISKMVYRKG